VIVEKATALAATAWRLVMRGKSWAHRAAISPPQRLTIMAGFLAHLILHRLLEYTMHRLSYTWSSPSRECRRPKCRSPHRPTIVSKSRRSFEYRPRTNTLNQSHIAHMDTFTPSSKLRLENQVAVVTGGAQGIGAGIVRRFVQEGARVVFSDLSIS
jgi:3-oxoacyl-ACP reductase-like protein